jgi:hypothetical protein
MYEGIGQDVYTVSGHEDWILSLWDVQDRLVISLWYIWCYPFVFSNSPTAVNAGKYIQLKYFSFSVYFKDVIILQHIKQYYGVILSNLKEQVFPKR